MWRWFSSTTVLVLPNHRHTLKMGTELVAETSENIHILTRLSVRENLMESRVYFRPNKDAGAFIITRFAGFTTFKFNPIDSRHSCRRSGWSYTHWENKLIRLFIVIFTWVTPLWWRCLRCVVNICHSRILRWKGVWLISVIKNFKMRKVCGWYPSFTNFKMHKVCGWYPPFTNFKIQKVCGWYPSFTNYKMQKVCGCYPSFTNFTFSIPCIKSQFLQELSVIDGY